MNATPMSINPATPAQPSAAGRQPGAAAADEPFSQLLSRELAQTRNDAQAGENGDAREAGSTDNNANATAETDDPAAVRVAAQPAAPPATQPATRPDGETVADTASDAQQAVSVPGMPQELLALALPSQLPKPEPGTSGQAESGQSEEPEPKLFATLETRKRRAALAAHTGQPADRGKAAAAQSGKADFQPATTAAPWAHAPATVAAGPQAAPRQPDRIKSLELPADPIGSPALRANPNPPAEIPTALAGAAITRLVPSVGTSAWNQALGEKIVWMAAGSQQTASLTLNPPNLGPLQIVLQVSNDQASASFFSAQPEVRQALEAAFPRLREMMDEAGIQLGQATVSADTPRQNPNSDRQTQAIARPFGGTGEAAPAGLDLLDSGPARQSVRGLIDTFA